jgi:hypothetical protein
MVLEDFFWLGDLWTSMDFHWSLFFLLHLRKGCGLFDPFDDFPSTINNIRPTQGGAVEAARRRHGLEVKNKGRLKNFTLIFLCVEVFCTVGCFS